MSNNVDILTYEAEGFMPVMTFQSWRLAYLNHCDSVAQDTPAIRVERHMKTDEVFVLLAGSATLIIGGSGDTCTAVEVLPMDVGKIYNVKQFVWHHIILSPDARVLIVEEADTSEENTQYTVLSNELRDCIIGQVKCECGSS